MNAFRKSACMSTFTAFALLLLTGCLATPRKFYDGPPLPAEQVSLIRINTYDNEGGKTVLAKVNGKLVRGGKFVALKPGPAELDVIYTSTTYFPGKYYISGVLTIRESLDAGKQYSIISNASFEEMFNWSPTVAVDAK